MTWRDALSPYQTADATLFDDAFLRRWASARWQPTDDDKAAAAKLHIQLVSRITTQRLGYLDGDEKTALTSVYALFEKAREIASAHPKCTHFDAVTWHVLNTHVRPFTAKWHAQSERGALAALDATDEFRADLNALQPLLQRFNHLLEFIRDEHAPPTMQAGAGAAAAPPKIRVEDELKDRVAWGIKPELSGFVNTNQISDINKKEREAIVDRRQHYRLKDTDHAAALAISGGGIRSATFALGVLVALAQRNLLPQFDYLSTVSGGGYLGSFLSAFLQAPAADVGLGRSDLPFRREAGEAAALRHLRHHSKYLALASTWERIKMVSAQLFGMALNVVAVIWMVIVAVIIERYIRSFDRPPAGDVLRWLLVVLGAGALLALIASRFGGRYRGRADALVGAPAILVVAQLCWMGLDSLHQWYAGLPSSLSWSLGGKETWIAIAGAIPAIAPALAALFPRLLNRVGIVFAMLTAIAAPVFVLGVYLFVWEGQLGGSDIWHAAPIAGMLVSPAAMVAVAGFVVYVLLFDVNVTSPHRHYRRKLAQAYVIQPRPGDETTFDEDVTVKLSHMGKTHKSPYHLINCALNVPASRDTRIQGRLTDFFLFSAAYTGSPLIGYWPTRDWEQHDAHLDVGTAMAISGAAAAPQMGLGTIRRFSFWLALLNVRLGYWARRPDAWRPTLGAPGILCLLKEMWGSMDEKGPWINLSDGGHIENLGVYELLRRRCKYIVAIDGEEDAAMTFHGLATLKRLAEIDLDVRIEADLEDLRLTKSGLSRSHFRFCRIRYPQGLRGSQDEFGYLLYVKLSLTGNEGEFIRRYRLDEPAFPHHSTADQFFSEEQFEAYRSLGEHVGNKLFLRAVVGPLAGGTDVDLEDWFQTLGRNLLEPTSRTRQ